MSQRLQTFSSFYFGHTVDTTNLNLAFNEGSGELTAQLNVGSYSLTDFAAELKRAMDAASTLVQTYTVSVARATRIITIAAASNFDLLITSGATLGTSAFGLAGFSGADVTGTNSYAGGSASGSIYSPPVKIQDYIPSTQWRQAVDASVNKSASGAIEVVSFGTESFVQANFKWITEQVGDNVTFKTGPTSVTDLETFMQYLITKAPVEFNPDLDTPATFETLLLESSPDNKEGVGYKIKEMYDKNLRGWYETGPLKFRVV